MSSLHDNNALNGHSRSVLSPNGGTVDFGSALSKSVFQQHKQNSKQQHNNQQPVNGGDFNQSLNPLAHYQDPAILGLGIAGQPPPPLPSTQHQQMDNQHQTVPIGMETSISLLQDPPLTVSEVEADAVVLRQPPQHNDLSTSMLSMSATNLLKSSKPSHTNNPLIAATNVLPETSSHNQGSSGNYNNSYNISNNLMHALKTTAKTSQRQSRESQNQSQVLNVQNNSQIRDFQTISSNPQSSFINFQPRTGLTDSTTTRDSLRNSDRQNSETRQSVSSDQNIPVQTDAQVRVNKSTLNARIIDVYQENLQEEFKRIRRTVKKYRYVAMDTEFPGVVAIPEKKTKYQQIRVNVDLLNIIQLGLCFMNEKGEMDPEACCWQFNFRFSTEVDMYAEDSINLLKEAGIPFKKLEEKGIDRQNFAELFITSGICLNNKVNWITFHAGYDFAYMLKLMRNDAQLPESEEKFFELLNLYFPNLYDIKYMVKSCKVQEGGLEAIANELDVDRIGDAHTAGSDAVLTGQTFFKVLKKYFCEKSDESGGDDSEGEEDGRKTPEKVENGENGVNGENGENGENGKKAEKDAKISKKDAKKSKKDAKKNKKDAKKEKSGKNSESDVKNLENEKSDPQNIIDPDSAFAKLEARKLQLQNQNKNTEKYRGIIYGIGSGVVNYHTHNTGGGGGSSRYGNGPGLFSGGTNYSSGTNFRGSTVFSSPGRGTNTPPGIAIVKPNKESQALVFTKPPADHDEKSSNNGSFKEKDSREVSKDVSKVTTPVDQTVPDVLKNNGVLEDIVGGGESQVPVTAV